MMTTAQNLPTRFTRRKQEFYEHVLRRLTESGHHDGAEPPSTSADRLRNHITRLPDGYGTFLSHNLRRVEDVPKHMNLLDLVKDHNNVPSFEVQVHSISDQAGPSSEIQSRYMHCITFAIVDMFPFSNQLESSLKKIKLTITEDYGFNTTDGYRLSFFLVEGWPDEGITELKAALDEQVPKIKAWFRRHKSLLIFEDGIGRWEINPDHLRQGEPFASGSFADLYRGTYKNQQVAIKTLKPQPSNLDLLKKVFAQEVTTLSMVEHENVLRFVGAIRSDFSIVTEYMSGGSVCDYLRKRKCGLGLPFLLKVALDVAKGMEHLHQHKIVHRDLKSSNLLMDENKLVKVADFGVARVISEDGEMTSNTGTFRWMAPEVIENKSNKYKNQKRYSHKVDVYSFGLVLLELLTAEIPYKLLDGQQVIDAVLAQSRPKIPKTNSLLDQLIRDCWDHNPENRPEFSQIIERLGEIAEVEGDRRKKGGFISTIKEKVPLIFGKKGRK